MNTGTCFLPSCTAIVWPTISGKMVELLDHVFKTLFSFVSFIFMMRASNFACTKGPFFTDLLNLNPPSPYISEGVPRYNVTKYYLSFLLLTMNLSLRFFFFLVLRPSAGLPQGVTGPGLPTGERPSPPPWG